MVTKIKENGYPNKGKCMQTCPTCVGPTLGGSTRPWYIYIYIYIYTQLYIYIYIYNINIDILQKYIQILLHMYFRRSRPSYTEESSFAAARDDNYNHYRRNYNYKFIIGGLISIVFSAAINPLMWTLAISPLNIIANISGNYPFQHFEKYNCWHY